MNNAHALDQFLASVERKAFRIANIATGNVEEALDIVQDAMLKLAQKYAHKGEGDWPALFYTILNSRIYDWYRRSAVRNRWRAWLSGRRDRHGEESEDEPDAISQLEDQNAVLPEAQLEQSDTMGVIEKALRELPLRQQQAFLLRTWEEFSVEETAKIMGCSEGSVKTHCSRAITRLRELLEGHDV